MKKIRDEQAEINMFGDIYENDIDIGENIYFNDDVFYEKLIEECQEYMIPDEF